MKKLLIAIVVLAVLAGAAALWTAHLLSTPAVPRDDALLYIIEPGTTLSEVAAQLEEEGFIRHAGLFRIRARLEGADRGINAGRYEIEPGMDAAEILDMLVSGRTTTDRVTIPEGLTIQETARIIQAGIGVDSTGFVHLAGDSAVAHALGVEANTLEGYLFPATYDFYPEMSAEEVLKAMTDRYRSTITDAYRTRAADLGYTIHEIMTLASIVEQEARVAVERDTISGVFHNRLERGMLLEADPTVQFGIGRPNMRLYEKHLSHPSPYNTYVHAGLPPGPICSPGAASIHAALYPREVPYLFFVARGDGSHIFSRTNREHNRARAWVKRQQR